MSLTKQKIKASPLEGKPKIYPTWDDFVQAKVDRTNELIGHMDQDALRKLIELKNSQSRENKLD